MKLFKRAARTVSIAVLCSALTLSLSACSDDSTSISTPASSLTPVGNAGTIVRIQPPTGTPIAPVTAPTPPLHTPTSGTASLDWTPPTQNSDGSTLTNLAGYHLYYGTSADNLTQSVQISNPGLAAYTLANLAAGTWYFAVTSYSSAGIESARSAIVSTSL